MTVTNHARDHDLTVQGRQAACGWALHLIATEKHRITSGSLKRLSWTIRDDQPRLCGLALAGTSAEREAVVRDWATHFGVTAAVVPCGRESRIEVDVIRHGVEVFIYAHLPAAAKEVA